MKKERIRKPDGRYLIYYSFEPVELLPGKAQWRAKARRYMKRNTKRRNAKHGAKGRGR